MPNFDPKLLDDFDFPTRKVRDFVKADIELKKLDFVPAESIIDAFHRHVPMLEKLAETDFDAYQELIEVFQTAIELELNL